MRAISPFSFESSAGPQRVGSTPAVVLFIFMLAFPFAPPPQYVQPSQLGVAPVHPLLYRPGNAPVLGAWSGLQAQPMVASPVCVMEAEPQGLGARGLQSPPTISAAPCGGFISMPLGAAATSVVTVAAAPKAASKKKKQKERVYGVVEAQQGMH